MLVLVRVVAIFVTLSFVGEVSTRPLQDVVLGLDGAPQLHFLCGLTEEVVGGNLNTRPLDISDDALQHPPIKVVEWIEGNLRELDPVINTSHEELPVGVHVIYLLGYFHDFPLFCRDGTDLTMFVDERRDGLRNFLALRSQVDKAFFFAAVANRSRIRYD